MKILSFLLLLIPVFALAQTSKQYLAKADSIMKAGGRRNDKQFAEAMALYNKAVEADPTNIEAYRHRAEGNRINSIMAYPPVDRSLVIADYNSIIKLNPNDIEAYKHRALERRNVKDYKGSTDDYQKLVVLDPKDAASYYDLIALNYTATDDFASAEKYYTLSIAINGASHARRSTVRDLMGDYQGALDDWIVAKLYGRNNYRYDLKLADLYAKVGNYEAAITACTQAIGSLTATIEKGQLYESEFEIINPYEERAKMEVKAGLYNNAMADYDTAIKYNRLPGLLNGRAELKYQLKDNKGACRDWDDAYRMATTTIHAWAKADSISNSWLSDGKPHLIDASNRNTKPDTLGYSQIVINLGKYCK